MGIRPYPRLEDLPGTLAVANGGTGAATAGAARTALGLGSAATADSSAFDAAGAAAGVSTDLAAHEADQANPHAVTASQVGSYTKAEADAAFDAAGAAAAVLPSGTGNSGKYLTTDGTSVSWASVSGGAGGASSSGDAGEVQVSDGAGGFTGDPALYWDGTSKRLGIGTSAPAYPLHGVNGSQNFFYVDPDSNGCTLHLEPGSPGHGYPLEFLCNNGIGAALVTQASAFNFSVGSAQFFFRNDSSITTNGSTIVFKNIYANEHPLALQCVAGQTGEILPFRDSGGATVASIRHDGSVQPAHVADADAANDSIYYSADQSKLAYKDPSGTVHPLYT